MRKLLPLLAVLLLAAPVVTRGAGAASSRRAASSKARIAKRKPPAIKCVGCPRDSRGRIKRSEKPKTSFRKTNPCPSTGRTTGRCPGYQIDHRVPLYKGGRDAADNLQWLSTAQHKAKHKHP